ncbi:hypothetical protein CHLRE_06g273700v5 [Chlamydomonas reinhardtii]|uniref:Photosystem II stability/assembly factor n=1 Tax=Chlamydomonas reinhardtii TaxID=3055 RepID=A0A2K3DNI1_CHLRE|nr:uncharacterized protein CHLRE_06g273700v5 [Chlamydomonas reinhardtii]PNW82097.1 hypothetical protein CHLRE_06g273700v5 [Chlamydomonas reinhardtii]
MALSAQQTRQVASARSSRKAFAPARISRTRAAVVVRAEAQNADALTRRAVLSAGLATAAAVSMPISFPAPAQANQLLSTEWELVNLPVSQGTVLLDIGFTDDKHGFLLGTRQTLLETNDGGKTWAPRSIDAARDEGFNYRFNSISFAGKEGWIVGKPAILLHTSDGGANWERIPLSSKLPGAPVRITGLAGKPGQAEMITDQGAIYVTDNTAYTWTAAVQETVDATLNRTVSSGISGASYYEGSFSNLARSSSGDYVAVSSRGNFYMTWSPGQTYWMPHNRPAPRRLQNMGFTPAGEVWVTTRGGDVLVSEDAGLASEKFKDVTINSRGFGILDVGFRDDKVAFACGGSGSLYRSEDGGKNWKRDRSTDDVAGNLYAIKFFNPQLGFVLGNDGILLRYTGVSA